MLKSSDFLNSSDNSEFYASADCHEKPGPLWFLTPKTKVRSSCDRNM